MLDKTIGLWSEISRYTYACEKATLRGHAQTMWTVFWTFLTPPPPLIDKRGHFSDPPN